MIGLIVPAPLDVSSTGYIRIVADQRHCNPASLNRGCQWELKVVEYDADKRKDKGPMFDVKESEISAWMRNTTVNIGE